MKVGKKRFMQGHVGEEMIGDEVEGDSGEGSLTGVCAGSVAFQLASIDGNGDIYAYSVRGAH